MKIYRTSNYAKGEDSFSFDIGGFCKKKKEKRAAYTALRIVR